MQNLSSVTALLTHTTASNFLHAAFKLTCKPSSFCLLTDTYSLTVECTAPSNAWL